MDAVKLLSNLLKNNSMGSNILGSLLGGGGAGTGGSGGGGGLGGLASMLGGGGDKGGMGGLLGSILGGGKSGRGGSGGGLGALAGMLGAGGGGGILGQLMGGGGNENAAPQAAAEVPAEAHQEAELLIRAMCNAAKADGRLDDAERENIVGRLGDEVTQGEIDFVQRELSSPVDVDGFARDVPSGAGTQVYSFSLMAIKLDEQSEANYLGQLAQALRLDADTCNRIHDQLGAPRIFR